jgi:phenylalanyl-tRNA synthetase beta chain
MKISYNHLIENIKSKPTIDELSKKLFQLGHEHEIDEGIFDIEFTPNRGDCLSVNGLLNDLSVFYDITLNQEVFKGEIKPLNLDFINKCPSSCPNISFLKIEIENTISPYNNLIESYFSEFNINKNNFFTDISNYIAYETGQPTHCYDFSKIDNQITLDIIEGDFTFETLFGKNIHLKDRNLAFLQNNNIINLAGVVGGSSTSCNKDTRSVIIECAFFNPEDVIGQTVKYDITSDAAYKFERTVDPLCHDVVLRRFIQLVSEHADIKNLEIFTKSYSKFSHSFIPFDENIINNILGTKISSKEYKSLLSDLGFICLENLIKVPSNRSDIKTQNDLAEEIARVVGYDNIPVSEINLNKKNQNGISNKEYKLKRLLIDNGFFEVINNPFGMYEDNESIEVDNPLDSNRNFLRTNLKKSLLNNLLYNERRQQDSIKLFEVSDIYYMSESSKSIKTKKVIGIICSGRAGKNYRDFSKKIDNEFLLSILTELLTNNNLQIQNISRNDIDTKSKNPINYAEFIIDEVKPSIEDYKPLKPQKDSFSKYEPISEYPSSNRDISVSISDYSSLEKLQKTILEYSNELLKDSFIFDFFENKNTNEIKVGFRFIFQSSKKTLTDKEIDSVMSDIINLIKNIKSAKIPGMKI